MQEQLLEQEQEQEQLLEQEQEQLLERCHNSLHLLVPRYLYEMAAEEGFVVLTRELGGCGHEMSKAVGDVVDWVHVHTCNGLHQELAQQLHYLINHKLVAASVAVDVVVAVAVAVAGVGDVVAVLAATTNIRATVAAAVVAAVAGGGSEQMLPFYAD